MSAYKIDKTKFDDHDKKEWARLITKGMVQVPADGVDHLEDAPSAAPVVEKAAPVEFELPAFFTDAIAKSQQFMEDHQKKEMVELAKKYEILDLKPDEVGEQLYELKKTNESAYDTCISVLDSQVALVEKSGIFAEIGKTGHSGGSFNGLSGAEAKAEAKAQEIMKAAPNISYTEAKAMAWDDPAIAAEYEAEYNGR